MEAWNNGTALEVRPGETLSQRIRRLSKTYSDYDQTKDPFTPFYETFNGKTEVFDYHQQLHAEGRWLQHHAPQFEVFPDVMCMSWYWPQWWFNPQVLVEQFKNGLPARLLHFPSGRQLWQITTPVHGFDEPGATLPDTKAIRKPEPNKEPKHE